MIDWNNFDYPTIKISEFEYIRQLHDFIDTHDYLSQLINKINKIAEEKDLTITFNYYKEPATYINEILNNKEEIHDNCPIDVLLWKNRIIFIVLKKIIKSFQIENIWFNDYNGTIKFIDSRIWEIYMKYFRRRHKFKEKQKILTKDIKKVRNRIKNMSKEEIIEHAKSYI